jgi:hypothetical protein
MKKRRTAPNSARSLLAFAATITVIGIAFSATRGEAFGGFIATLGALTFVYALHRFGRLGPDDV